MTTTGKHRLRAVIGGAAETLELDRGGFPDPMPGEERGDVAPGNWEPDKDGMPPECPVQVLGMDGDVIYLVDAMGQLAAVSPSSFGLTFIQRLFADRQNYLYWAWPAYNKEKQVSGWRAEKVRECFYQAAGRRGLWKALEKVRGLGAWRGRDGELILHCGDYLVIGGKLARTGEVGGHFYPRRPAIARPWAEPVGDETSPAAHLFDLLKSWNWRRGAVDPILMLGWIGAAMLGGALRWRPAAVVTGGKGTGKSSLHDLIKILLGDGMISTPDTTPAGIYQRIGNDALPVAVDELEAEADNRKVMAVVRLARLAASGGLMLRGGADHQGVEFQARSCFLFSAINPPPMPPQDVSRMPMLSLDKLKLEGAPPVLENADEAGPMLMRRLMDGWSSFDGLFDGYASALRGGGHDRRGQDTFGTLLVCAHLLMGDMGMEDAGYPIEDLGWWGEALAFQPESARDNWSDCLEHLLTSQVDAWRGGMRHTVGALIEALQEGEDGIGLETVRLHLGQINLGLLPENNSKVPGEMLLAVPVQGPALNKLFVGTAWGAGVWTSALRQGPGDVVYHDKSINAVKIGGVNMRCTLVALDRFQARAAGEG